MVRRINNIKRVPNNSTGAPQIKGKPKHIPTIIRLITENIIGNKNKRKKIESFRKNLFLIFMFFIFLLNNFTITNTCDL